MVCLLTSEPIRHVIDGAAGVLLSIPLVPGAQSGIQALAPDLSLGNVVLLLVVLAIGVGAYYFCAPRRSWTGGLVAPRPPSRSTSRPWWAPSRMSARRTAARTTAPSRPSRRHPLRPLRRYRPALPLAANGGGGGSGEVTGGGGDETATRGGEGGGDRGTGGETATRGGEDGATRGGGHEAFSPGGETAQDTKVPIATRYGRLEHGRQGGGAGAVHVDRPYQSRA